MAGITNLSKLTDEISRCRICCDRPIKSPLPHEPRPVLITSTNATIAICGQAPGTRVQKSGIPFTDPSGDRLRGWIGVCEKEFYDPDKFAIVPMGFCFPGLDEGGADLSPRRECALTWRRKVIDAMPQLKLLLVIGIYAQTWHIGKRRKVNLTQTVAAWREYLDEDEAPTILPLPHPSWRNNSWLRKNPWFDKELLPVLKEMIQVELGRINS